MLRLVGVDAAIAGESVRANLSGCRGLTRVKVDASLADADFRRAATEGRLLLCGGSRKVAAALPGTVYQLLAKDAEAQFAELLDVFGLSDVVDAGESRCGICNADCWLHLRPADVHGRVPQGVLGLTDEFFQCASCEQIFWPGPKYSDTMDTLKAAVSGGSGSSGPAAEGRADDGAPCHDRAPAGAPDSDDTAGLAAPLGSQRERLTTGAGGGDGEAVASRRLSRCQASAISRPPRGED
jgi:uncharacterized protein with PIN domain